MNQFKIFMRTFALSALVVSTIISPMFASGKPVDDNDKVYKVVNKGPLYTAYNIWYEPGKENAIWCINYKRGEIIPAGTEVTDIRLVKAESGRFLGGTDTAIAFRTVDDGKEFLVNFKPAFHPDKTIDDYMDMMFTTKDFAELTKGMNDYEIEAIKEGKVKINMSKDAILVSYGYPPEHRTPDLKQDSWLYWMNRFQTKDIHFNDQDMTYRPQKDPNEL